VALFEHLIDRQALAPVAEGYALTEAGRATLAAIGLTAPEPKPRRRYAYRCLDWSERRDHLAGQLADALLAHCLARDWLRRDAGRAVQVTEAGRRGLLPWLGVAGQALG
jgi:hypothetical protein